jgi:hypothetical protein
MKAARTFFKLYSLLGLGAFTSVGGPRNQKNILGHDSKIFQKNKI